MEVVQSQVHKLKTRIDKVVTKNYSSVNNLNFLVPCDALASSAQNVASSPENGNKLLVESLHTESRHTPERNMGDLFMHESTVSSHGEVAPHLDMVESTGHPQVGGFFENVSFSFF